ncbi:MAG: DUF4197 domain-containing protein [Burkholderiaceae bacterium]|jgi:hypothetical protein|uniref:DUF4197 domain-containing protein n=1 Tax=Herminiimonas contaminans TaxID=1111140 RepID=A0ABS0ES11_9BURK|nr:MULTISPECIES: DUF4197 domain-containing protein [Oxalobacteraceae]MBF8177333.1 DUF4197 domain-containing protein [Herminiimonas contaminans]MBX9799951.1 DUF4197 domain-containing protein [Burkholderiaceae bacterium]
MLNHHFSKTALAVSLSLVVSVAFAASLADLSNKDATSGVKAALEKGATVAVSKLGVENGFLNNEKVKIGLPSVVEKAMPILKMTGQGKKVEELQVSMNHAAESAVALAKPLLLDAVKSMSVSDAKNILTGGDTSVTDFFRQKTATPLGAQFLPVVKKITDKNGLAPQYNAIMGKVGSSGLVSQDETTVEGYVTKRALDGLYTMIGEEEKAIRQDPVGAGSAILGKVFGALK